jgi:hypothetical protein
VPCPTSVSAPMWLDGRRVYPVPVSVIGVSPRSMTLWLTR